VEYDAQLDEVWLDWGLYLRAPEQRVWSAITEIGMKTLRIQGWRVSAGHRTNASCPVAPFLDAWQTKR
jgi:hypothetical protein